MAIKKYLKPSHGHCERPCYSVSMGTEGFLVKYYASVIFSVFIVLKPVNKLLNDVRTMMVVFTDVSFMPQFQ